MPSLTSNYTNLSIEAKRADKLKRTFDTNKFTGKTYAAWCIGALESSLERILYLRKAFPSLNIIENYTNRFIIEDIKSNKIVKVEWKNNELVCNDKDPKYILFASLHPDFRLG